MPILRALTLLALSLAIIGEGRAQGDACPGFRDAARAVTLAPGSARDVCRGDAVAVRVAGVLPAGEAPAGAVELHAGPTPDFTPGAATLVGARQIEVPYDRSRQPRFKGHTMWGCGDERNEYSLLWSGGGIVVDSAEVRFDSTLNEGCAACDYPGSGGCPWRAAAEVSRLRPGGCTRVNYAGPGDTIPPEAMVVVLYSALFDLDLDVDALCREGDPVYVMQANCTRLEGGVVRDALHNLAGGPYPGLYGTNLELYDGVLRSASWRLAGVGQGPGHFERTPPEADPSRGRIDCAAPRAWGTLIGGSERLAGSPSFRGFTFAFDYTVPEGTCGPVYFRAVARGGGGACAGAEVTDAAPLLQVSCPTLTLTGEATACVGDEASGIAFELTGTTRAQRIEYRIGGGAWLGAQVPPGTTPLAYTFATEDEGADLPIELRLDGAPVGCVPALASAATVTVGGDACGPPVCTPPEPRFLGLVRSSDCDIEAVLRGDPFPFTLDQSITGVEEVLLLYEGDFGPGEPRGPLIRDFGTTTPTFADVFDAAAGTLPIAVVVRRRRANDPTCFADARPWVIDASTSEQRRTDVCRGGTLELPDGSFLSADRPVATYRADGRDGACDTVVTAVATFVDAPTDSRIILLCTGGTYALPDGTELSEARPSAEYTAAAPDSPCDSMVTVRAAFSDGPACQTACTPPEARFLGIGRTTYCTTAQLATEPLPFALDQSAAGIEEVLLLYAGEPAGALLADFGTRTPDFAEVFAAAGDVRPLTLVLRRRRTGAPDCFADAAPYVLDQTTETATEEADLCRGGTLELPDGTTLSEVRRSGTYTAPGTDGACDTLVTVNTVLVDAPTARRTFGACGEPAALLPDGQLLTAAFSETTYRVEGVDGACDSVITAVFGGGEQPEDTRTVALCPTQIYPLPDGTELSESRRTATYTAAAPGGGCDSVVTVTAEFGGELTDERTVQLCEGQTFALPDGTELSASRASAAYRLSNPGGACDSVVTVMAEFREELTGTRTVQLCEGETFDLPDGTQLDASRQTAVYRVAGVDGACDSVVTATAVFGSELADARTVQLCEGGTYDLPDGTQLSAARTTAEYRVSNPGGACDSVVTVTAAFGSELTDTRTIQLCEGETFELPDGTQLDADRPSAQYRVSSTDGACDSVVTVTAEFEMELTDTRTVPLCEGETFALPDGTQLDASRQTAVYRVVGTDGACDSVVTVTAAFAERPARDTTVQLCPGQSFRLPDGSLLDAARPTATFMRTAVDGGCDTVVTATAEFAGELTDDRDVALCPGGTFALPDGTTLSEDRPEATYRVTGGQGGCDSVVTVRATFDAPARDTLVQLCTGRSLTLPGGLVLDAARPTGTYVRRGRDGACDTVVTATAEYADVLRGRRVVELCPGATFTLPDGSEVSAERPDGEYRVAGVGGACDSLVTVVAEVIEAPARDTTVQLCPGGSYRLPGGLVLDASQPTGSYTRAGRDGACDTVVRVAVVERAARDSLFEGVYCRGVEVEVGGEGFGESRPMGLVTVPTADGACDSLFVEVALRADGDSLRGPGVDTLRVTGGDSVRLAAPLPPVGEVNWTGAGLSCGACRGPSVPVDGLRTYAYVYTSPAGCTYDGRVTVAPTPPTVGSSAARAPAFPTAFSPDGDGVNDALRLYGARDGWTVERFEVFDRWGGRRYERTDAGIDGPLWDGTSGGQPLDAGTYVAVATVVTPAGERTVVTEAVTLVR